MSRRRIPSVAVVWDGRAAQDGDVLATNSRPNVELYNALLDRASLTIVARPLREGALVHLSRLNGPVSVYQVPRRSGLMAAANVASVNAALRDALRGHSGLLAIGPGITATLSLAIGKRLGIDRRVYFRNTMPAQALLEDGSFSFPRKVARAATAAVLDWGGWRLASTVGAVSRAALSGRTGFVMPEIPYAALERGLSACMAPPPRTGSASNVLFVGRLERVKGPDLALRAVSMVADAVLTVVGDGSMKPYLFALARELAVADRVRFVPAMTHDKVLELIRASECVVVPSRSEAFGLVALEAVAVGTPVVVSRVGGLPEATLGSQHAVVVEPTADDIAAGIRALRLTPRGPVIDIRRAGRAQGWFQAEDVAGWLAPTPS